MRGDESSYLVIRASVLGGVLHQSWAATWNGRSDRAFHPFVEPVSSATSGVACWLAKVFTFFEHSACMQDGDGY
jgi:hypothetical protein